LSWRNHTAFWAAIGIVVTFVLAGVVVVVLRQTGDPTAVSDNAPLIAAVIALGGVGTTQMVSIALEGRRTREARELEDGRTREGRELEDQRAREGRELEAQRANEAALRNYFEDVGKLLIEKPLRQTSPGDDLSTVVRAQTLSVLEGLDPERKRILLQFLYESGLINKEKPVVDLLMANLRMANLGGAFLNRADLSGTYLSGSNLHFANLNGADLSGANLRNANLSGAYLARADLHNAYLGAANLSGASLTEADLSDIKELTDEQIHQAKSLKGAIMPDGSKHP
jgi:uncharacterized protein YjbI with pentapeptide repeats